MKKPKKLERVEIKSTTRKTKTGVSTVKRHNRLQLVNADLPKMDKTKVNKNIEIIEERMNTIPREFNVDGPEGKLTMSSLAPGMSGINLTLFFDHKDTRYYYKPQPKEPRYGDSNREVFAYEATKLFGLEGLIPPTKQFSPKIYKSERTAGDEFNKLAGSVQMEAEKFGAEFHELTNIRLGEHYIMDTFSNSESLFEQVDNFPDLLYFDYLMGNFDRHSGNYFIGESKDGGLKALAIDNGYMCVDDHDPKKTYITAAFENYISTIDNDNRTISNNFYEKLSTMTAKELIDIGESLNVFSKKSKAKEGIETRLKYIQDQVKHNMHETAKNNPQNKMPKEKWMESLRKNSSLSVNDFGIIFKKQRGI